MINCQEVCEESTSGLCRVCEAQHESTANNRTLQAAVKLWSISDTPHQRVFLQNNTRGVSFSQKCSLFDCFGQLLNRAVMNILCSV